MSNELVPYQGRNDIAYVNRELATARDQNSKKSSGEIFRVSDMYIGRYGVLGYVELSMVGGSPHLMGIIEVPGRLVDSMKKVPGMTGYVNEVVFESKGSFTSARKEDLKHPSLEGVALFDSTYFWHPHPEVRLIDPPEVAGEIKLIEGEVIDFITNFDGVLDRFVPEDRRPTYSTLSLLGPGLGESPQPS